MDMLESQRGSENHWDLVPDWIYGEENHGESTQELWVDNDVFEGRDMYNFGYIMLVISGRPLDVTLLKLEIKIQESQPLKEEKNIVKRGEKPGHIPDEYYI